MPPSRRSPAIPRRRSRKADRQHPVYELDLYLVDSEPLIWRSLAVPAAFSLADLHTIIQCVMPWEECHLHQFETRSGTSYREPSPFDMSDFDRRDQRDEAEATLADLYDELCEKLAYQYDFGDSWLHGIKLVTTHADAEAFNALPRCLAGENAAPPEDTGGIFGYYDKLEILKNPDPKDEWHESIVDWMGEDFDPSAFDLEAANAELNEVFSLRRRGRGRRR